MNYPKQELFEKLSALEHQRWSHWQKYLHSKCFRDEVGNLIIPETYVKNLERLINTDYKDLTGIEKNSDRNEVMKYWKLIIGFAVIFRKSKRSLKK